MARHASTYRAARRNAIRRAGLVWNKFAYYDKSKAQLITRRIKDDRTNQG